METVASLGIFMSLVLFVLAIFLVLSPLFIFNRIGQTNEHLQEVIKNQKAALEQNEVLKDMYVEIIKLNDGK